jgi:hypothetical protein
MACDKNRAQEFYGERVWPDDFDVHHPNCCNVGPGSTPRMVLTSLIVDGIEYITEPS